MSYNDPYGKTQIVSGKVHNLLVSWDVDEEHDDTDAVAADEKYPVLLFTPNMDNTAEHYHVHLDRDQATALWLWLTIFLRETEPVKCGKQIPADPAHAPQGVFCRRYMNHVGDCSPSWED